MDFLNVHLVLKLGNYVVYFCVCFFLLAYILYIWTFKFHSIYSLIYFVLKNKWIICLKVIPCFQRDGLFCLHENGCITLRVRRSYNSIFTTSNDEPGEFLSTVMLITFFQNYFVKQVPAILSVNESPGLEKVECVTLWGLEHLPMLQQFPDVPHGATDCHSLMASRGRVDVIFYEFFFSTSPTGWAHLLLPWPFLCFRSFPGKWQVSKALGRSVVSLSLTLEKNSSVCEVLYYIKLRVTLTSFVKYSYLQAYHRHVN